MINLNCFGGLNYNLMITMINLILHNINLSNFINSFHHNYIFYPIVKSNKLCFVQQLLVISLRIVKEMSILYNPNVSSYNLFNIVPSDDILYPNHVTLV